MVYISRVISIHTTHDFFINSFWQEPMMPITPISSGNGLVINKQQALTLTYYGLFISSTSTYAPQQIKGLIIGTMCKDVVIIIE